MRWDRPRHVRFVEKVEFRGPDDCWPWRGSTSRGYGVFWVGESKTDRTLTPAHRYAYELLIGPIPAERVIDHLCRNTLCVNPMHMEPVTIGENTERGALARTTCKNGHPRRMDRPARSRTCLVCKRERQRERVACIVCNHSHSRSSMARRDGGWICAWGLACSHLGDRYAGASPLKVPA